MAIRTMIRGLVETLRVQPARACLAFGAALLLASSAALADYAAGLTAFNRKEYARAFSEWIDGAKAGDAHAQHGLGMLYELGQGVPYADPTAAAEWYEKAAAQDYAPAINNLARLYADGRGVQQNVPKAIELWSKAAAAGNITAQFNLGLQYASGSGVPRDMKKAADYMLQAADGGLPEAQFAVAGYYREGTGVAKDVDAARLWYERAASAGFEPAQTELAALDKPPPSAEPAASEDAATPAEDQQAPAEKTDPPAPAEDAEAAADEKPVEEPSPEPAATESQQAAAPPPAEQPDAPPAPEASTDVASTEQPPAEAENAAAETAQPEGTSEKPASESAAEADAQGAGSDLPVAESLTGDEQVYRIWLYTSGQEGDARSYWDKLSIQYPRLLKPLQLDLRRYFLGEAKGSLYRVFAGPFEDLGAAQKACEDIKQRSGDQFCRPVLN
jgi:TPR repeat protein